MTNIKQEFAGFRDLNDDLISDSETPNLTSPKNQNQLIHLEYNKFIRDNHLKFDAELVSQIVDGVEPQDYISEGLHILRDAFNLLT